MDFRRALEDQDKRKRLILICVLFMSAQDFIVTRVLPSRWVATVRLMTPAGSPFTNTTSEPTESVEPDSGFSARVFATIDHREEVMEPASRVAHVGSALDKLAERIELEAAGARMCEPRYYDREAAPGRWLIGRPAF